MFAVVMLRKVDRQRSLDLKALSTAFLIALERFRIAVLRRHVVLEQFLLFGRIVAQLALPLVAGVHEQMRLVATLVLQPLAALRALPLHFIAIVAVQCEVFLVGG